MNYATTKKNVALTAEEDLLSDRDAISTNELALDLNATTRSTIDGRIFWKGNVLVRLGRSDTDLSLFLQGFTAASSDAFKEAFLLYADSKQPGLELVMHVARILRAISKELSPNKLDVTWASHSLKNISFRRSKRQICNFLEFLNDRHPGLVTNDALNFLLQAAYPKQSSRNVESDDPTKSWLTDQEYDDIVRYSWNHYDLTNSTSTALIRLLSAQYARRPSQLASLKFCDLKSDTQKVISELPDNEIHFPAAKERDAGSEFRAGKVEAHPIAKHLWDMLKIQRKEIKALFEKTLNLELSDSDAVKLPVFTNSRRIAAAAEMLEEKLNLNPSQCLDDELFHLIPLQVGRVIAFEFDMAGTGAGRRLRKDERELLRRPTSSRTNQPIIVTATRLRHTRARQLARQGVPKETLKKTSKSGEIRLSHELNG